MKNCIVLITMVVLSSTSFGQNFEIKKLGSKYSSETISLAFESANVCGMIYKSKRYSITFDDGTEVELLSAVEIINFNDSCAIDDSDVMSPREFSILNGKIIMGYSYELSPEIRKSQVIQSNN